MNMDLSLQAANSPRPRITKGLHEFRRYAEFVEGSIDSFSHDRSLARKGLTFVHFIDFQEIYNYVAPFVIHPREGRDAFLNRFIGAQELFENGKELFCFPLGTLAEVSAFVKKLRDRVQLLHKVMIAPDLDRAAHDLATFFEHERFLEPNAIRDFFVSQGESSAARLTKIQSDALVLLSDFEVGASRLLALLEKNNTFDISTLLREHPVHLRQADYNHVLASLKEIRRAGGRPESAGHLRHVADAFNTCFATVLNDRFDVRDERGANRDRKPWFFFKILTDTNSLFTLSHELDSQLTYRDYHGFGVPLFERCDQVLLKRRLSLIVAAGKSEQLEKLATAARTAKNALMRLGFMAEDRGMSSEQLLDWLAEPPAASELSLAFAARSIVDDLRAFAVEDSTILGRLLKDRAKEDLALNPRLVQESATRPYSPQSVLAVSSLLDSIESVVRKTEHIEFELTPPQRKYSAGVWNPLLTLESLGFQRELIEAPGRQSELKATWMLSRRSDSAAYIRIDIYQSFLSFAWPTAADLEMVVNVINEHSALLNPDDRIPRSILSVDQDGREYWLKGIRLSDLNLGESEFHQSAFIRIDFLRVGVTAELFSVDINCNLTTGLLMTLPVSPDELIFMIKVYRALTYSEIPFKLLLDGVGDALKTYPSILASSSSAQKRRN
jgi:hypothetical protein